MKNNFFKSLNFKEYLLLILKIVLVAVFIIFSFKSLITLKVFFTIHTEVLITTSAAFIGAIWKYYIDKENLKIKEVKKDSLTILNALRTLDLRVDSLFVQLQDIRSSQFNDCEDIEKLNERINELSKKLIDSRNQLLSERIELIIEFYKEIGLINNHISMNRNFQSVALEKTLTEQKMFKDN